MTSTEVLSPIRATDTGIARAVHVTKIFGRGPAAYTALDDVSVSFETGSFTAIMGPSGSGKSTLMHCMAGLDNADRGQVYVDGVELGGLNDRKLTIHRRDRIGFVFQSFNLLPMLSAKENITLPLELAGRKVDKALFEELVTSLGLSERLNHRPAHLSGGQQQRVAVARALITRPAVVFADEPTGALDSKTGAALLTHLRDAAHRGQTIVMVTHDPVAATYADRAILLADGQLRGEIRSPDVDAVLRALSSLAV